MNIDGIKERVKGVLKQMGLTRARVYRWVGKSKLSRDQQELLALMRRDNQNAPPAFRASDYWIATNRQFDDWFRACGIDDVETQEYNVYFSGKPSPRRCYEYAIWMLYCLVKQRDHQNLLKRAPATTPPDKGLSLECEGNLVSWDQLVSIDTAYSLAELHEGLWTEPLVILDLGAGYGRMGYVLKTANPNCVYVDCDLPEGSLVASSYLPKLLPRERVTPYPEVRGMKRITRDLLLERGGLWFCGTQDLPRFADKSVDVFVNIASFQEMTRGQVEVYLREADRTTRGAFYCQEFWRPGRHRYKDIVIGSHGEYAFPSHWDRVFLRNACFSERFFETGYRLPTPAAVDRPASGRSPVDQPAGSPSAPCPWLLNKRTI
ncbi:MAG TPA: putative sugar O-methyltransferase [Gemmataceae bacterium]|nr:putative sugar O-methyltransferase [Gemmataceae bacterium]